MGLSLIAMPIGPAVHDSRAWNISGGPNGEEVWYTFSYQDVVTAYRDDVTWSASTEFQALTGLAVLLYGATLIITEA